MTTFGGLVTLASPESLPEGASPRCHDNDYVVGGTQTRDGLTSVYSYAAQSSAGPNGATLAVSSAWANPTAILANTAAAASVIAYPVSGNLDVTQFSFALPSTDVVQGIVVTLTGYATAAADVNVQLLKNGVPVGNTKTLAFTTIRSSFALGSLGDVWNAALLYSDVNNTSFGIRIWASSAIPVTTAYLSFATITVGIVPNPSNFTFIDTFTDQDGTVRNISQDANGDLWVENVTANPGILDLAISNITPNSTIVGVQGEGVYYMAFSDGFTGSDVPRQYTSQWTDRITQVGPGISPVFTPGAATSDTFAIATITQPAGHSVGFSYFLQSGGPGSTSPGNVVTVYYSDSTLSGPDNDLVTAFNSGNAVYIFTSFTGAAVTQGPYVQQVTSVGEGQPPGQPRKFFYFTYQLSTSIYTYYQGSGHSGYTANYQRTLATMTMSVPVPGLSVGNQILIAGTSVTNYDGSWPISQTVNSGEMAITATQVASGVATFTYSLASGVAPAAGQLVTITGTNNANGQLNMVNATIVTASGGSFTINVSLPDAGSAAEQGQATTAGTIFTFDPGFPLLTTSTSPIYGTSTGGTITFGGPSGQFIGTGTRQGVVFFITRNGYYTAPSPPVTFTCPANTTSIRATQIPIGPPNVIARGISFTEAGQNGVPGANFFTIPTPVQYIVSNVSYTSDTLIIRDNTSTSASFFFTDSVLLNALAIDVYGYNLFNQIEIGNPGWIGAYSDRNFYGLCQNKIQNFNNLSFDGGYLPPSVPVPLGWTAPDIYGQLLASPIFGNSYYIKNTSGGTLGTAGLISQTAFQDAYQQPILNANTTYSVRVTARVPSGITTGSLTVYLTSAGSTVGSFSIPFASMTSAMAIYTGTLLTTKLVTVPADLTLNVAAINIGDGADVEIDRSDVFPTLIPVLGTTVFGSYAGLPEQVDAVTGQGKFTSENQQPVNGAVVMYDTLYALKGQGPYASMYSWQASSGLEPAEWSEPEVAQRAGACGIHAFDFGEQWIVTACRNGLYLFEGGQPGKIMQEIYQVWDAINWEAAQTIWVKNDVAGRRLFVGVPMATPNFWLPDAPVNSNPMTPNVILMMNYQGLDTGAEIKSAPQMHTTMFGSLNAIDMRRKWSIWQIPSPYGSFVRTATDKAFYICNGKANSKVYKLDPNATTDDGTAIPGLYTTYGFVDAAKAQTMPALGSFRKRCGYMMLTASSSTSQNMPTRFLPNVLLGPGDDATGYNAWTVPGGFNLKPQCLNDFAASVNFVANRMFVEFSGSNWNVSALILHLKKEAWAAVWGPK